MSGNRRQRLGASAKKGASDGVVDALSSKDTRQNALKAGLGGAKEGYQAEGNLSGAIKGAGKAAAQSVVHDVAISAAQGAALAVVKESATIVVEEAVSSRTRPVKIQPQIDAPDADESFFCAPISGPSPSFPVKMPSYPTLDGLNNACHKPTYLRQYYHTAQEQVQGWSLGAALVKAGDWKNVNAYLNILKDLEPESIDARSQQLLHADFLKCIAKAANVEPSVILNLLNHFNLPLHFINRIAKIDGLKQAVKQCIEEMGTAKWDLLGKCIQPNHSLGQFFMAERNWFYFLNPWHRTTTHIIKMNEALLDKEAVDEIDEELDLDNRESFSLNR